ncbi:hypothetical protein L3N51_02293 [Metallosphaera sp. J1]|uniref:hypothetical protein n=1 Tax=Metallosphaera TaxID=41980 RepID=UPI001EDF5B0D|nr:hypothetical protein [Metallosphaera javensis (ex Hofmann et al. 2022)]MCG3109996.1 hypothetical protein [Metallosphaera javensis (ex Hofmann et al. 2022)]BCS93724.1 MAG: hypothetical protein MjAS7_2332 [Metallosphaera javensis (ex Sakai et al. 2022)]
MTTQVPSLWQNLVSSRITTFVILEREIGNRDLLKVVGDTPSIVPRAYPGIGISLMTGIPRIQIGDLGGSPLFATNLMHGQSVRGALFTEFSEREKIKEKLALLDDLARSTSIPIHLREVDINLLVKGHFRCINSDLSFLNTFPTPCYYSVILSNECPKSGNIRGVQWREIQIGANPEQSEQVVINGVLREKELGGLIDLFVKDLELMYDRFVEYT